MPEFEPSDWKQSKIPRLSQLDSLQRCLICKDFLKAPVSTSCNHIFCSQCIRQHLISVSRCPLCKTEQFESNLKRAVLLEEIVSCFKEIRNDLISLVASEPTQPGKTETQREAEVKSDVEVIEVIDNSTPALPAKLQPGQAQCPVCGHVMNADHLQRHHINLCLEGKKDTSLQAAPKRKQKDVSLFFQRRTRAKTESPEVDHERFYFQEGHKHQRESKRIPKIDFASLSTSKVKEKLAALKLATLGSRAQLELRYNHYYLLQNSNLDSNRPVSDLELRQRLNQWEKSHQAFSAPVASNTIFGDVLSHKSLSDKDFPVKAWLDKYRDEFRLLVRAAKKSRKRRAQVALGETKAEVSAEGDSTSNQSETSALLENSELSQGPAIFDFSKSTLFSQ